MTIVTRQNLLAEKTRFLISVGGIALSVFLISFLLSLFQGWNHNVGRFVERVDAEVWVAREGTTDFLNAASILPATMQEQLAHLSDDVESVDAMVARPMNLNVVGTGEQANVYLIGYQVEGGAGGPLSIKKGQAVPGEGEIIVDLGFAKRAGVGLGDVLEISGQRLTIVGISTGGDFIFNQTAFISLDNARTLLGMSGLSTFYLLQLRVGADAQQVVDMVKQDDQVFDGVSAFTGDEFATATRDQIMGSIIPILFVILFLAFVVGVAITGLTIYNATIEKAREYGILKAIGFTNGYLFRLVLEQSLVTGLLGFVIGLVLTIGASQFASDLVPEFITLIRWQDVLLVLGITILMSVIAALLPVRRLASVDPVDVFNA